MFCFVSFWVFKNFVTFCYASQSSITPHPLRMECGHIFKSLFHMIWYFSGFWVFYRATLLALLATYMY